MQTDFRNAMATLSAAVNVITTAGPHGRAGLTASAVCSVTDSPPTVLVCINRNSALHPVFVGNGKLCINILSAAQEDLARQFAGMTEMDMAQRLAQPCWHNGNADVPVLGDALASLEGTIVDSKSVGSHNVLFVELQHINLQHQGEGLAYFARRFHRLPREVTTAIAA